MTRRTARLTAVITGKAREVGAEKAHERNVLAITRRIHKRDARIRELAAELLRERKALRQDRAELRAVLQRDHTMAIDDEDKLAPAGRADAIDAAAAVLERGRR